MFCLVILLNCVRIVNLDEGQARIICTAEEVLASVLLAVNIILLLLSCQSDIKDSYRQTMRIASEVYKLLADI